MKRSLISILLVLILISLSGCSTAQGNVSSPVNGGMPGGGANGTAGQMPESMQLAIGMFKLDETSYPIDKEQAARLLFLWKGARALSASDTAATEELNGLFAQIKGALNSDQLQAIRDMNLKMSDLKTLSQELGISLGMGGQAGAAPPAAPQTGASSSSSRRSGGGFGGGMPMGFGGPPGGPMGGSSSNNTARFNQPGMFMGLSSSLVDQIIVFLADRAS